MTSDPALHHRRSIRLRGFDYSEPGHYFVTVCTRDRLPLFGEILGGEMRLNDAGQMVTDVWQELPQRHAGVTVDAFVVMPNHVHGIVVLLGRGQARGLPLRTSGGHGGPPLRTSGGHGGPPLQMGGWGCPMWCTDSNRSQLRVIDKEQATVAGLDSAVRCGSAITMNT